MKTRNAIALSVLLYLILVLPASAMMVEGFDAYIEGDDVRYDYNSSILGMAIIDGNKLTFLPTEFKAVSSGGANDVADLTTLIKITSLNPEVGLASTSISEVGDYLNLGEGASSTYGLGTLIDGSDQMVDGMTMTDTGSLNLWTAGTSHELDGAESVILTLENLLIASSGGEFNTAFIEKKGVHIDTTVVPVPAAVWLFGSVLATLGLFRRHAK